MPTSTSARSSGRRSAQNERWRKEYVPKIRPLLIAQENKILSAELPLTPPADTGNVYELRWYRAHAGRAGEWLEHFKAIMPTRDKYTRRVGLWQTQAGQLNEVVHMWAYRDLNDRAAARAKLGQDPAWQAFLGKSVSAPRQHAGHHPQPRRPLPDEAATRASRQASQGPRRRRRANRAHGPRSAARSSRWATGAASASP